MISLLDAMDRFTTDAGIVGVVVTVGVACGMYTNESAHSGEDMRITDPRRTRRHPAKPRLASLIAQD